MYHISVVLDTEEKDILVALKNKMLYESWAKDNEIELMERIVESLALVELVITEV